MNTPNTPANAEHERKQDADAASTSAPRSLDAGSLPFDNMPPMEAIGQIPEDPASQGFAAAIVSMRRFFEDRQAYSEFICEQLAARGVAPNTNLVCTLGKWGSRRDVSNDVKAWYAKLARKLSSSQIDVPEEFKRPALHMIEQMWRLCADAAKAQVQTDRDRASAEFARLQSLIDSAKAESVALLERLQQTEHQRDSAAALAQDLRTQLDATKENLAIAVQEHQRALDQMLVRHEQQMAEIASEHENRMQQVRASMQEQAEKEIEALHAAHATHSESLLARIKDLEAEKEAQAVALRQEIAALHERVSTLNVQLETALAKQSELLAQQADSSRAHAMAISRARDDLVAAHEKLERAQAKSESLREKTSSKRSK